MNEHPRVRSWAVYFRPRPGDTIETVRPIVLDSFHPAMPEEVHPSGLRAGYACRVIEFSGVLDGRRYDDVLLADMTDATGSSRQLATDRLFGAAAEYIPIERLLAAHADAILAATGTTCRRLVAYGPRRA